jgi:hypothetical protein
VRRGSSIRSHAALAGISSSASPEEIRTKLDALGIRIYLEHDTDRVGRLVYLAPYPRKVCGVWIGASASEVMSVLGESEDEDIDAEGQRAWTYERGGHLYVRFDEDDLVELIVR